MTGYLTTRLDDAVEEETTMPYYGEHMSGWDWFGTSVGMILFWGLLITGIVLLVRYLRSDHPGQAPTAATAEQVLAERFARGEINETEYRDRLATLRGQVRT